MLRSTINKNDVYSILARILHGREVCGWLQEDAGVPDVSFQADQGLVSRGHLDHHAESWHILHFTRCVDVHAGATLCKLAMLNTGN